MKVICCHADSLRPETRQSVTDYAPGAEFIDTSEDDYAYWRAIKERWDTGEDLVIIEQDMQLLPGTIPSLESCKEHWCVFPYHVVSHAGYHGICVESLGCTRFSSELQSVVKARHISQDDYRHWTQVAGRVSATLTRYGYRSHVHEGSLEHYHDEDEYDSRISSAQALLSKMSGTQEYRDAVASQPDEKPNYWETRYDLPPRRLPG